MPLVNHLTWSDTNLYANQFYTYASNNNNNNNIPLRFYIYETWHCILSGSTTGCVYDNSQNSSLLWHPRLQADFSLWTGIVNHVRSQNPNANNIWMIPAGQAFYNLVTEINNNNLPGINSFTNFFTDDIHLNNMGNYFVACVMFATLFGESPIGLTSSLNNEWGVPFSGMPTTAQANVMQQVAWQTVTSLAESTGVDVLKYSSLDKKYFKINSNPVKDFIEIQMNDENNTIKIYDSLGQLILMKLVSDKNVVIDVSSLSCGMYFLSINNQNQKFVKN